MFIICAVSSCHATAQLLRPPATLPAATQPTEKLVEIEDVGHRFTVKIPVTWKKLEPKGAAVAMACLPDQVFDKNKSVGFVTVNVQSLRQNVDELPEALRKAAFLSSAAGLLTGAREILTDLKQLDAKPLQVGNENVPNVIFTGMSKEDPVPLPVKGNAISVTQGSSVYIFGYYDDPAAFDLHVEQFRSIVASIEFKK